MTPHGEPSRIGPGRLILVVGPSGAGKDTLIRRARDHLAGDPTYCFPRRVVTRPPSEAEDNEPADEDGFRAMDAAGAFAITWAAHGLSYGISRGIDAALASGRSVVCNVSRTAVPSLRMRYENVRVIEITAPPQILARRLCDRGRSEDGDPTSRLIRSHTVSVGADLTIINADSLEDAVRVFLDALTG